jgi:hypothetical protein
MEKCLRVARIGRGDLSEQSPHLQYSLFIVGCLKHEATVCADLRARGFRQTYSLDRVPEAMRHLEAGEARGKVAITI